jgi:hypothetical protein
MKLLITILLQVPGILAMGQVNQKQWLIGGNLGFSYSSAEYIKTTDISLSPDIGYFFLDKFAGGLRFDLSYNTEHYSYASARTRQTQFTPAPFLRYYFLPSTRNVNLFFDGSYGYSFNWYKYNSSSYTYHYWGFSLMAGPVIFLNEHTALEITLGYNYSTGSANDTLRINSFKAGVGLQIHFGG